MQPHEKSVKPFADCLFSFFGSRKPFPLNKHEQFTLVRREPSQPYSQGKFTRFQERENKSVSSIIF